MRQIHIAAAAAACFAVLALGCAPSMSGKAYSRSEARTVQTVEEGEVVAVREVLIEGTKTPVGVVAGGLVGGVLGSMVGGGKGQVLSTVLGGLGGAAAGAAAEEGITKEKGLELTVKLSTGQTISVVQSADVAFQVGDKVRILRQPDGTARVSK